MPPFLSQLCSHPPLIVDSRFAWLEMPKGFTLLQKAAA